MLVLCETDSSRAVFFVAVDDSVVDFLLNKQFSFFYLISSCWELEYR